MGGTRTPHMVPHCDRWHWATLGHSAMLVIPNTQTKLLTSTSFVLPSSHFQGVWLSSQFSLGCTPQWQECISFTWKKEKKKKKIELILNISDCNRNDCLPFSLLIQQAQYIKLHWMSFLPNWGNSEKTQFWKLKSMFTWMNRVWIL